MAWLARFDDFDQFDDEFDGKSTFKQNPNFYGQGQSHQQAGPKTPAEVKKLSDITPQTSTATITGVIIAKDQQKSVFSKKNVGSERHLVSFTLRDSPSCFVNVTCWGNIDFINDISSNFQIGQAVQLKNAQIQQKSSNPGDEKFRPWTPVCFQVNVSDNQGGVESYTGWDSATYRNLLSLPTRPSNDYYTLEDINISGMALQGEHVNILAAVKRVGQIRTLTTKTGKQTKKCDVVIFDDTCPSFSLDLWQNHADTSLLWTPFDTVLFIADVKISFNDFKSSMVATADSKTIFTTDPDTQEAHCLRQFLRSQDNTGMDVDFDLPQNDADPDLSSITEVFTVKQLKDKRKVMAQDTAAVTYYGVLNAVLTHFNIDENPEDVVRTLCGRCRRTVFNGNSCTNPECSSVYTNDGTSTTMQPQTSGDTAMEYNIPVAFSDFTGTVSFCHLQSSVSDMLLGCKPEAFLMLPVNQKTFLKWQYLLEQWKVIFKLRKYKQATNRQPSVQILSMELPAHSQNPQN